MSYEYKDAKYSSEDKSSIDLNWNHPVHGWIPCTINAEEYPEFWAQVLSGTVLPFQAPLN